MKNLLFLSIIIFANVSVFSQNLSVTELFSICNKSNWDQVNEYILKKGWEYHESKKGDDTHYSTITWSYDKEYYGDKAKGWFYLFTYDGSPNKIVYIFSNKASYNTIKKGISSAGMKLISSSIEDNEINLQYSSSNFILTLRTAKKENEDNDYNNNSITTYSINVIKKAGVYDSDNGLKKEFDSYGNIEFEYTLKNGLINGIAKHYYSNGQVKIISNFIGGKKYGNSKEFDEFGNLTAEYNYLNGELNGIFKVYENGKLIKSGSYINGKKNGLFKIYDEEGRIDKEYNLKFDLLDGAYIEYNYEDGRMFAKLTGFFANEQKTGLWQTFKFSEKGSELFEYKTYINDEKNGPFKEVSNDSIIFGTYKKGMLDGNYKVYKSISTMFFGGINGDTTNCPIIVTGKYDMGKRSGHWNYYSLSGKLIKEGIYYDDVEYGEWKYYFENYVDEKNKPLPYSGKLFLVENYEDGKKNGKEIRYGYLKKEEVPCDTIKNSTVNPLDTCNKLVFHKIYQTSYYKNNELHGPFEQKDSNGITTFKGNYIYGKKDGMWLESYIGNDDIGKYYRFLRGSYINGFEEGIWEEFVTNEFIYSKSNYSNGKLNGKTTNYNSLKNLSEEKYFTDGKLNKLIKYDSLGMSINLFYEILYENEYELKCRKTEFNQDGKVSQEYLLRKNFNEVINHNYFEVIFFLKTANLSEGSNGYPYGDIRIYDKNDKILLEGTVNKADKVGKWKIYFYDIKIYTEQDFEYNVGLIEHYFVIETSKPFSGKFIQKHENGNLKYEFKISDGLRDGKSKYYDENGNVIKIEKFKKGILQVK